MKSEIEAYERIAANTDVLSIVRQIDTEYVRAVNHGDWRGMWVNQAANALSQSLAYEWLNPFKGETFLQLGGDGRQAVRALLSGAITATLVTPVYGEAEIAEQLSMRFGVAGRLDTIIGTGEQIPLEDKSGDLIYGDGTLHHMVLPLAMKDVHRVLVRGGRAAFVEPHMNFAYRIMQGIGLKRAAAEKGVRCNPITVDEVMDSVEECQNAWNPCYDDTFRIVGVKLSGGLSRYVSVGLSRLFGVDVPVGLSEKLQRFETKITPAAMLGGMAVLLQK